MGGVGAHSGGSVVKNLPASAGDARGTSSVPGGRKIPWRRKRNPLQDSCLENPHGQRSLAGYSPRVAKSRTQLSTHAIVPSLQVRKLSIPRFIILTVGDR